MKAIRGFELNYDLKEPSYSTIYSCITSVWELSSFYNKMNENLEYVEIYFNKYKNNRTIKKRKNIISNLISDIKKSLK